jgi:hypothetical protein
MIDLGLRLLAAVRLRSEGNLVGPAQERDRAVDIPGMPKIDTDPSRLGQDVVWLGASAANQLIPHRQREGNVHEMVAVNMTDLAVTHAKFHAAKAVRSVSDFGPTCNRSDDLVSGACDGHC